MTRELYGPILGIRSKCRREGSGDKGITKYSFTNVCISSVVKNSREPAYTHTHTHTFAAGVVAV